MVYRWLRLAPFLTGAGVFLFWERVSAAELILALTVLGGLAFQVIKRRPWSPLWRERWVVALVATTGLSLLGYALSDLLNATAAADAWSGAARWGVMGVNTVGLLLLLAGDWDRLPLLVLGLALGKVVILYTLWEETRFLWKLGVAIPITLVVALVAGKMPRVLGAALMAGIGGVNLWLEYRSWGAVCFVTAGALLVPLLERKWRLVAFGFAFIGGSVLFAYSYIVAATGWTPNRAYASNTGRLSQLQTGTEMFFDSPLWGNGTRAFQNKYRERHNQISAKWSGRRSLAGAATAEPDDLSIHSQVLTALAEGGLLGASFFLVYGALLFFALRYTMLVDYPHRAVCCVLLVSGFFDYFMTPFSKTARFDIALTAAIAVLLVLAGRPRPRRPAAA